MSKHVMLDLETLGLSSNSAIMTVSMAEFGLETGSIGKWLELKLNVIEQLTLKGTEVDIGTIQWWQNQSNEAKQSLQIKEVSFKGFKNAFTTFIDSIKQTNTEQVFIWGNGATFDNVLLRNMYKRFGEELPIPFYCDMDVRTITQIIDYTKLKERVGDFIGIKHRGLSDCIHQIKMVHEAIKMLKES